MKKVHFDFETRSRIDLKKAGTFRYAEDSSTDVLCLGYAIDVEEPKIWIPSDEFPAELAEAAAEGALFYAHNVTFDYLIWNEVLCRERPDIPTLCDEQIRDVAAMALAYGLPRKLEDAANALRLSELKDESGKRLINELSKPDKNGKFNNSPDKLKQLYSYCMQDVRAERELAKALPELTMEEQNLWLLTLRMNEYGVPLDKGEAEALMRLTEEEKDRYNQECVEITGFSLSQNMKLKEWLNAHGCPVSNLQKGTIAEAVGKYDDPVGRVIELLSFAGGTATAKFKAMLTAVSSDSTLKGQILYHGASTGRFSSVGINIQNLARPPLDNVTVGDVLAGKYDGEQKLKAIASCVRSVIKAPEGMTFVDADFSSIENRVAYWIAGDEKHMQMFREGLDEYVQFASIVTGTPADEISKDTRQQFKIAVLGSMYGSGAIGFANFARGYGLSLTPTEAKRHVDEYRANHPLIVGAWGNCEGASVIAVREGKKFRYGKVIFDGTDERVMTVILPSGRHMVYQQPHVGSGRFGGEVVKAWGVDAVTKQWMLMDLYSSKLFQNIVQATARDLLTEAIMRMPKNLGEIVASFHDEVLILTGDCDAEEKLTSLIDIMTIPPSWAPDLPLAAEGWTGPRFRK
jgi:DNA polymerase bacteriophage-type